MNKTNDSGRKSESDSDGLNSSPPFAELKKAANEIYDESMKIEKSWTRSQYRKKRIAEFPKNYRGYVRTYLEQNYKRPINQHWQIK